MESRSRRPGHRGLRSRRASDEGTPSQRPHELELPGLDARHRSVLERALWNQCQHGGWFFLPWHRMFLYHFEETVRAAVVASGGPADWALPYWNYDLSAQNAKLPLPFRQPADATNPLFVGARAPAINSGEEALDKLITSPDKALARPNFVGSAEFGGNVTGPGQFWRMTGRLEQTPHNDIHGAVGGESGLMANVRAAAQDPIFWLHHANIDRLWSLWSSQAGHSPPGEQRWHDQSFDFFDKDGNQVSMKCGEVLETAADLGYVYDTDVPPTPSAPAPRPPQARAAMTAPQPHMVGASEHAVDLVGATATVPVQIDARAAQSETGPAQHVYLNVEDIEGETNPGSAYGIYLNLPDGGPTGVESPHHVGNLSFFGIEHARNPAGDEHGHGLRVAVDITGPADELKARNEWDGHEIVVTFRPVTSAAGAQASTGGHPPVRVGRVSVFYDA